MNWNFRQKIFTGAMVFLIAVFIIPSFALAFHHGNFHQPYNKLSMKRHHEAFLGIWQHPKTIQELKLTDEQVKKLKEADFARRENCLQLKSKLDGFHLEMEKLFAADSVNETKVIQLAQKISDAKGELFVERIKSRLTLIDLLTEDQLSKLKKYDWCPHDKHGKRLTNRKHHRSSFNRGDKN